MQPVYNIIFRLLTPFLRWHLARRISRGKEIATRLQERFGYSTIDRPAGKLVWMHGASNGESLSLLPIVERLRALAEPLTAPPTVLVTTGTVTSAKLLEARLPSGCIHRFIPLDDPRWVARFLDHWRPDGVLWVESELWPGILSQARARGIPAALLNARLSERSARRWQRFPRWAKAIADTFMTVTAQTPADAQRWAKLRGRANPQLLGNLKFVADPLPFDAAALAVLQAEIGERPPERPLWLFASAHPGEELVARDVHRQLRDEFPDLLTIVVPRHVLRGAEFTDLLRSEGHKVALRSRQEPVTTATEFYIADTMGELGLFYRLSQLSVVGGSFVPVGGHNPIEPALLGSVPLYGPQMFKQRAICAAFEAANAARPVTGADELAATLRGLLRDQVATVRLGQAAKAVCEEQAKSGPLIWDALADWRAAAGLEG